MMVKCGREEFEVNSNDVVLFNGACWQILTREVGYGWNSSTAQLAKATAKKMVKNGELILVEKKKEGTAHGLEYYKFNV